MATGPVKVTVQLQGGAEFAVTVPEKVVDSGVALHRGQ